MDMKKILQAMDGISTKPVEGSDSMAKFLRVVKEANLNQTALTVPESTLSPEQLAYNQLRAQLDSADSMRNSDNTYADVSPEVTASTNTMRTKLAQMAAALQAKGIDAAADYDAPDPAVPAAAPVDLNQTYNENSGMSRFLSIMNEGASPHKVALPVQMAMNHYQKPQASVERKPRIIDKYFTEAEAAITQRQEEKRAKINQYASVIAERVLMKESKTDSQSVNELSTELLGKYKKAAGVDAKKADAEGDYARGNKRFSGIVKATKKQFDNDAKKHKEQDISEDNAAANALAPAPRISEADAEAQIKQLQSTVYKELASIVWGAWPSILDTTFGANTPQDRPATPEQIGKMLGYRIAEHADDYRQKVRAIKTAAGVRDPQSLNKTSAAIYINEEQIKEEKQRNSK